MEEETIKRLEAAKEINEIIKNQKEDLQEDKIRTELGELYEEVIQALRYYVDMKEENYSFVALWILGSHMIDSFETFPYLFINAPKGSGKTRLMRLITYLAKGRMLNSVTESVIFRTNGCLGIDEFEGLSRKGTETIRELLNSGYKRGSKIIRMKEVKTEKGRDYVEQEFSAFRPIVMANINGMDSVLEDRCFVITLDKSNDPVVTKRVELFDEFAGVVGKLCSLCNDVVARKVYNNVFSQWNMYIYNKYIYTQTTQTTESTSKLREMKMFDFFNKVDESGLNSRTLEISLPLLTIANYLNKELFEQALDYLTKLDKERKETDLSESYDIALLEFLCNTNKDSKMFYNMSDLTIDFQHYLGDVEDHINSKWLGWALRRLNIILDKRRKSRGQEVRIDIAKAETKLKIFKP